MLVERPVRSIARAVADAAQRWTHPDFPPRVRALGAICERTGYSAPVVEYALDRLFAPLEQNAIEAVIHRELGSLDVLDRFALLSDGSRARGLPVGRVCVISSRTTIGVAIVPAIFALCAKCSVVVKDREDALVAAFFATLAEELDELHDAAVAQRWDGKLGSRDLSEFAAVVAFGSDPTLQRIRAGLTAGARWIGFGSRASSGYVAREALGDSRNARHVAEGAARDLVLYDTEGCLSLHVLFVESGGAISPQEFATILAQAVERASIEFPPSRFDARATAAVVSTRDGAAFRATTGSGAVYSDPRATYLAVLDPPFEQSPAFLPRTLCIFSVASPAEAARYLAHHRLAIEAIAVAGARPDIADLARTCGAARTAPFGSLQSPPLGAYHGGRPRISEFVRWITDEP